MAQHARYQESWRTKIIYGRSDQLTAIRGFGSEHGYPRPDGRGRVFSRRFSGRKLAWQALPIDERGLVLQAPIRRNLLGAVNRAAFRGRETL